MRNLPRRPLLQGAATALMGHVVGCTKKGPLAGKDQPIVTDRKQPTIFVPHGGGPWPFVDIPGFSDNMQDLRDYLVGLPGQLPQRPRALLVVSAHWEEQVPTVQAQPHPPMLYDYSGFPPESYAITWPAPGSPPTAERVRQLLTAAHMESAEDSTRGYDHGTFVVTKLMYPEADVPTFQLSLTRDLDPARCFDVGRALAPLRDEGVLILGSGYSYHNMRGFFAAMRGDPTPGEDSKAFDDWLTESLAQAPSERHRRLMQWPRAPRARACHPREEHLLPLVVCAGAGAEDEVTLPFHQPLQGLHTLAAHFG